MKRIFTQNEYSTLMDKVYAFQGDLSPVAQSDTHLQDHEAINSATFLSPTVQMRRIFKTASGEWEYYEAEGAPATILEANHNYVTSMLDEELLEGEGCIVLFSSEAVPATMADCPPQTAVEMYRAGPAALNKIAQDGPPTLALKVLIMGFEIKDLTSRLEALENATNPE